MHSDRIEKNAALRAIERKNKIFKTITSGFVSKGVSVAVQLAMVPLAIGYLGKEQYGIWIAATSLLAMIAFADAGAGNAVINLVASASDSNRIIKIISSAFYILLATAMACFILFVAISMIVPWGKVLGIPDYISTELVLKAILIIAAVFFTNMVLGLAGKVQRGFQEGNLDNYWNSIGALLSLLFAYVAIRLDVGFAGFIAASLSGVSLALIINNVDYFYFKKPAVAPRLSKIDRGVSRELITVGGMFFILQLASAIQMQSDNIILAYMLGPAIVSEYAVTMKVFVTMAMLFSLFLIPLWPSYRSALASGDRQWVKSVFILSIKWALLISVPLASILVLYGAGIIELWVGKEMVPSASLLVGCGVWMVCLFVGSALAMLLNALQLIKMQIIVAISAGAMNIALSIWLIELVGMEGAVYASIITYFICGFIPYSVFFYRFFYRQQGELFNNYEVRTHGGACVERAASHVP